MADDFRHISNRMLANILEQKPAHVSLADLRTATGWTIEALGRDVISDDIPALALQERIQAAREADRAIEHHRLSQAHRALRRFWSI
jgi:hypothetical protein